MCAVVLGADAMSGAEAARGEERNLLEDANGQCATSSVPRARFVGEWADFFFFFQNSSSEERNSARPRK